MKPKARAKRARERSEHASEARTRAKRAAHDPKCIRLGVNTCRRPLSVFIPECTTAWSTMEPTDERSEWTMEFQTPWKDTSGPTGRKGGERIYTPEQISQDPHAMQVYVQLKRIMQTTNGRGRGWILSWSGILQKTRGVIEQKQSSWNKSIIYSIHLKGKVIFSKCGNCAVESRRHF